jgi:hypothetical protein
MGSIKKYFIPKLYEYREGTDKFSDLAEDLQKFIIEYLDVSHQIAIKNRFIKKVTKQIREEQSQIKRLKKRVTNIYPKIKSIPSGYSLSTLFVEKDRNSYRLNFEWLGLKKKCSLGSDLNKIRKACRVLTNNPKLQLTKTNFREIIKFSFNDNLNDFLHYSSLKRVKDAKRVKFDFNTNSFLLTDSNGIDLNKLDKISQSKKLGANAKTPTNIKKQNKFDNSLSWWGALGNLDHSLTKDNDYHGYIKGVRKFNFGKK